MPKSNPFCWDAGASSLIQRFAESLPGADSPQSFYSRLVFGPGVSSQKKESTLFTQKTGTPVPDPFLQGIEGQRVQEPEITVRGLYADAHAEALIELEAISRDIQHFQAGGNQDAVSRLRILESHVLDRLAAIKSDAIADMCFGVRSALQVNDQTLPECLKELLNGQFATKGDLAEIKAGLKFVAEMFGRGR